MQEEALSSRRLASTLTIGLVPLVLGILIYAYWLNSYFNHFDSSPLGGKIPTIGFALLVIAVPANFLGIFFLYIPMKKCAAEVRNTPGLKGKFYALFALLFLNYAVAGGIIYNYSWLTNTVSIQLENNYPEKLRDLIIVLPNGDGIHMNEVMSGQIKEARVVTKGEGQVEFIVENMDREKLREVIIGYVTPGVGARVKLKLNRDYSLSIFPDLRKNK